MLKAVLLASIIIVWFCSTREANLDRYIGTQWLRMIWGRGEARGQPKPPTPFIQVYLLCLVWLHCSTDGETLTIKSSEKDYCTVTEVGCQAGGRNHLLGKCSAAPSCTLSLKRLFCICFFLYIDSQCMLMNILPIWMLIICMQCP